MPFYGQSIETYWAENVSGSPLNDGYDVYYHYDDLTAMVASGESFLAGIEPWTLAASTDSLEISYVVECGPASNGVLRLSAGLDPAFALDNPALATEELGEQAAFGQVTIVVPTTSVGWAELDSGDALPILFVECTTGAVEVLQVKLRVWPAAGPMGAWTTGPSSTVASTAGGRFAHGEFSDGFIIDQPSNTTAAANAMQEARDELATRYDGSIVLADTPGAAVANINVSATGRLKGLFEGDGPYTGLASINTGWTYFEASYEGATPDFTGDTGNDPREIAFEERSWVRGFGGGALGRIFAGWNTTLEMTPSGTTWPSGDPIEIVMADVAKNTLGYELVGSVFKRRLLNVAPPDGPAVTISAGGGTAAVSGGPYLIVSSRVPGLVDSVPTLTAHATDQVDGVSNYGVSISGALSYYVTFGDYEYFNPTLPWVDDGAAHYLPPGQFLFPAPNLDGAPGEVDVNFATS